MTTSQLKKSDVVHILKKIELNSYYPKTGNKELRFYNPESVKLVTETGQHHIQQFISKSKY